MPCGKRPLVKNWDKPRNLRVITPSPYEQTLTSVKVHWQNVIKDLEMSYKDEKFWESNCATVRELVGPVIFQRIAKIFDLQKEGTEYQPTDQYTLVAPSNEHTVVSISAAQMPDKLGLTSYSDLEMEAGGEEHERENDAVDSDWTEGTIKSERKPATTSKSLKVPKSISKMLSKSFSRHMSMLMGTEAQTEAPERFSSFAMDEASVNSHDDLDVQTGSLSDKTSQGFGYFCC